jgi:hypothetical protein
VYRVGVSRGFKLIDEIIWQGLIEIIRHYKITDAQAKRTLVLDVRCNWFDLCYRFACFHNQQRFTGFDAVQLPTYVFLDIVNINRCHVSRVA